MMSNSSPAPITFDSEDHQAQMKLTLVALAALWTLESVEAQTISYPVGNRAGSFIASVGIGSPPTSYDLLIDTASSNTWIGAGRKYEPTSSSKLTGDTVAMHYGNHGEFSGEQYFEQVTLGDVTLSQQSIGVASKSKGYDDVDGVLGLGPSDLSVGTLSPHAESSIPTVVDSMFAQGIIGANMFSIFFEPITEHDAIQQKGQIFFGGTDRSKYTGEITYTPTTTTSPASSYWGIDASFTYDGHTILASPAAGTVDSGTTLLSLATPAFEQFQRATGAVPDAVTGLLTLTENQFDQLQPLYVHINKVAFKLTPNALIWPRFLNTKIGGAADKIYLIVQDAGSAGGDSGLDFVLGQVFMERFYTVFDTANRRVGFATTRFTDATTN
ncbi:hypothetical protein EC968_005172 [Mortierella alpina]|nr:hypothetical protein EC968_005172 [Mortierella alpina]